MLVDLGEADRDRWAACGLDEELRAALAIDLAPRSEEGGARPAAEAEAPPKPRPIPPMPPRRADGTITAPVAQQALSMLQIDAFGLDEMDRRVLETIVDKFDGGPVGLETIAASISEEADTIMDVVEPYLLQLGFLDRTPRGRLATRRAYDHLGLEYPERLEQGRLL